MMEFQWLILLSCVCASTGSVATDGSIRFMVIGDWGGLPDSPYTTPVETHVATGMGLLGEKKDAQFILALGDNFYYDGVKTVDDKRFQETFESVYTAKSLYVPWYLVAGNHDHNGNVSAEIEYSKRSKRWNFPNYYYLLPMKGPSGMSIDIIMIDTVMLCGNTKHDIVGDQPHGAEDLQAAEDQWTWIELQLQQSRANYLVAAGHFPVWSVAEHGPTQCLLDRLMPLLYKYKATAYFCGHDHNLQHLVYSENSHTVNYFVSGSANFIDPSMAHKTDVPKGSLRYHSANITGEGGIGYVEVTAQQMLFTFYDNNVNIMYQHAMQPRK